MIIGIRNKYTSKEDRLYKYGRKERRMIIGIKGIQGWKNEWGTKALQVWKEEKKNEVEQQRI